MSPNPLRQLAASWYAPAVLAVVLLIGLAVWVRPVRIERPVTDANGNTHVVTAWDTSRWQAVSAYWWQALLLGVGLLVLVGVTWYGRGWVVASASAARFFAA